MRLKHTLWIGIAVLVLAGCKIDVDSPKTPTVIASPTLDETAVARLSTKTATRTPTITPSPSETSTLTQTATVTVTATLEPSETKTPRPTSTYTRTPEPSATRTPQPSDTLEPSGTPTEAVTATPTRTLVPSATASRVPTITPLPVTPSPVMSSPTPFPTRPIPTPFPTLALATPQPGPSATQSGTFYDPNAAAQQTAAPIAPAGQTGPTGPALPEQNQVVVSYAGQVVPLLGLDPSGNPVSNPMAHGTIFTVNQNGDVAAVGEDHLLYVNNGPLVVSPASIYGLDPNLTYGDLVWSPNGQRLAFRLDATSLDNTNAIDAGVWVYDPGQMLPTWQAFRNSYEGAQLDQQRQALVIHWSPDSGSLAITVQTPLGRANVFMSAMHQANDPVVFTPYADANWGPDSHTLIVSGPGFDGYTVIGRLDESNNWTYTEILNQRSTALYMQAATLLNDGWIAFLGGESPDSFALYTTPPVGGMQPQRVSIPITGQVLSAEWNLARTAVLVTAQTAAGRQLWIVRTDGTVQNATPGTPGFPDVAHWR